VCWLGAGACWGVKAAVCELRESVCQECVEGVNLMHLNLSGCCVLVV